MHTVYVYKAVYFYMVFRERFLNCFDAYDDIFGEICHRFFFPIGNILLLIFHGVFAVILY